MIPATVTPLGNRASRDARPAPGLRFFWLACLLVGVGFALTEQQPMISTLDDFIVDQDQMAIESEEGTVTRRLGFSLVALAGVLGLMCAPRFRLRRADPMGRLVVLYCVWCFASILWSTDPPVTTRRLLLLSFCIAGALGICRQVSLRELALFALVISGLFAVTGVGAELALGTFRPWSAEYRFAGMIHPNAQGAYCAALCLAALALIRRGAKENPWLAALFAIGFLMLLLTRSRTAVIGFASGLVALVALRTSLKTQLAAVVAVGFAAAATLLVALLSGTDVEKDVAGAVLLGRQEDAESFNGRVPLWAELMTQYVARRPWNGYGYGAFWNAQHIDEVSSVAGWEMREAHSAYVESLLSTGLIGTGLLLTIAVMAVRRAAAAHGRTGDGGGAFIFAMLAFAFIQGTMESGFVLPYFLTFVAACGTAHLAFCFSRQEPVVSDLAEVAQA